MILTFLMLACALALSGVAAFYSIAGLMAIFAAAPIPIAIMGSILEGSKLVIASWLYRSWTNIPLLMKTYFTFSLGVLMFLTSMGIFGFLSKAHIEQKTPTSNIAAEILIIEEKISIEQDKIKSARNTLAQLDAQVNETIARTAKDTNNAAVNRSITIRRQQAKERDQLAKTIAASQASIIELNTKKAPLASNLREVEAEVGPIKYIASLIYGDQATKDPAFLEKAVRAVTLLIVIVFDPLAVIMLVAASRSMNMARPATQTSPPIVIKEQPEPAVQEPLPPIDPEPIFQKPAVVEQPPKVIDKKIEDGVAVPDRVNMFNDTPKTFADPSTEIAVMHGDEGIRPVDKTWWSRPRG